MRMLRLGLAAVGFAALLSPQPAARLQVGPLPDGGVLLDTAWILRPAGRQVPLGAFPVASAVSPDGKYLVVLNAGYAPPSISVLEVAQAREIGRTPVADAGLGLAFSPKGDRVYVGGGAQAAVLEFTFAEGRLQPARTFAVVEAAQRTARDFIGDVALSPDGRLIYAADLYRDSIVVVNPQSGRVIERFKTGRRPYRILFHPDGKSFFVSSWADGAVLRHGTESGEIMTRLRLAPHPTDMVWLAGRPQTAAEEDPSPYVARIFVATANTNSVYSLGVTEANDVKPIEAISMAMTQRQPLGMTPSALGIDSAPGRLYAACSDANAVAVVEVARAQARVVGLLPVGAYPTAVRPLAGGRVAVVNGKGEGSPMTGTVSFIEPFTPAELENYTRTVFENSPYRDSVLDGVETGAGNPIPGRPGASSPIQNVVYIITRGLANDEAAAPNSRKLSREFVLLDNFYRNGDSFEEGIYWATAAIAPDYVQKLWGEIAARRRDYTGFDGSEPAAVPPAGYLWTNAIQAGLSVRNYGCFPKEASLTRYNAAGDSGAGSAGPVARAQVLLKDLAGYEAPGQSLPRLLTACLEGNSVGDVDRALGMIVEGVSRSRFWPRTAIFVVEAGGLGGKVRADGRRSPAFAISPYVRRRSVDSTMYNTLSALRTMELVLGLHPMTHFDAAALPLSASFQTTPDVTPYQSVAAPR
jgi:YVTN family beta-propeller protein